MNKRTAKRRSGRHLFFYCCMAGAVVSLVLVIVLLDILPACGTSPGGRRGHRGSGGGGFGIGIGIQIAPRVEPAQEPNWDQIERDLNQKAPASTTYEESPSKAKTVAKSGVDVALVRKLVKPRVPYLIELAMDIDRTLMELALTEPVNAVKLYKNAAARARSKGDAQEEREALQNLGHVYFVTGQFQKAVENYAKVLEILQRLPNPEHEAIATRNISAALTASADYQDADQYSQEALEMLAKIGNKRAAHLALNNAGVLEKKRGRFQKAETYYEESLSQYDRPDPVRLATLNNLGTLYRSRGQFKEAIAVFQASVAEAKSLGDPRAEADALDNIGQTYASWGNHQRALESWSLAVETLTKAGAPTDWVKKRIGDLYLEMGRTDEAELYVQEADYDSSLGLLKLARSDPDAAKKHYERLLNAAQKEGNLDELFSAYTGLGKAYEALGKYPDAEKYYSKGMEVVEDIRSTLLLSERRNFFSQKVSGFLRNEPAKGLVRVMLKQKKMAQSIQPSEATRAREFADFLFQKAEGSYFEVPQQALEQEMAVNDKVASLKIALGVLPKALDVERFTTLSDQIKRAESAKKALVQELSRNHKGYAAVKYPKPVTLENSAIHANEYVLLFDVLGEGIGIRLIKGKRVISATFVQWPLNQLQEEITAFRKPFEQTKLAAFSPDLAASLYHKLLGDALNQVPEGSPLTIIPDGLLALLPFEALVTGGTAQWVKGNWGDYPAGITFLGDRHPIVYYQSVTALTLARNLKRTTKRSDRVLVVADPVFQMADARLQEKRPEVKLAQKDENRQASLMAAIEENSGGCFSLKRLKGTERLAKSLEQLYGSSCDVYTGLEASKNSLMQKIAPELSQYNAIVFATHGFAGNNIPGVMEPVLALTMVPPGVDGFLTMSEVAGLKTNADIVALTACQTGVGVDLAGEGVLSIGRAFQCAGARAVAMSLWSVSEDSSVALMDEFFKRVREGKPKLEAWTEARRQLRKAGFEHPFFWASFVLVGEAQ